MDKIAASAFLDAMPHAAILLDPRDRIAAANSDAHTMLGQDLKGRPVLTVIRNPAVLGAIEACRSGKTRQTARYVTHKDGRDATFNVTASPIADAPAGAVLLCFEDLTQFEQAGQMRRDFVANVSHELRTPLTALLGFIETLRGPARDDAQARARFLGIMATEAGRMNRLIKDLLSLSQVESEERVRPGQEVDLRAPLNATLHALAPLAEDAGVTFDLRLLESPVIVTANGDQLRQVFTNLIENAIKYGGKGGTVSVSMTPVPRDPVLRSAAVQVAISDTGPGIDPVHIPRLTERFYRVDNHRSREMGGTGLGLAIVKHIVSRHRGRLRITSEMGKGSTFTVTLPVTSR